MPLYDTVAQALAEGPARFADKTFTYQDAKGVETTHTYVDLERLTGQRAAAMQAMGLTKGDRVGLVIVEPEDFVLTFYAAIRLGVVPVPLYPPLSFGALDAYAERTARVLELAGARVLFASGALQNVLWGLVDQVPPLERLVKAEDLRTSTGTPTLPEVTPDDIAFLQYTSGSTSDPKGVIVTHANLVANCSAIVEEGLEQQGRGVAVSWLPLYHDMGLIGFVIATLLHGFDAVFIPTMRFIKRPHVWFDALTKHKGTVTFAPNFAYALMVRKATPARLAQWDLSSVEAFGCGAEPIHPDTVRAFDSTFSACGLKPTSFMPAYGMAEATLAISFKPLGKTWQSRVVDAERFQEEGLVTEPAHDDALIFEHVACGPVFDRHDIGAFDDDGTQLPEGVEGELCLRGPSVTPGYFQSPDTTAAAFRGEWLRTGDLGYVLDGHVYVTGRLKDLIILNGRNLHPQAIEWVVGEVDGVRKGNVVAFSRPGESSEELVVVLETRETAHDALIDAVKHAVRSEIGAPPADVVCLEPGALPKTSSGKLQRRKTRSQYLLGKLGKEGNRTMGAQGSVGTVAKHVARGVFARAKNALRGS